MNNNLIEKIKQAVTDGKTSFDLKLYNKYYNFIVTNVYEARYIFGDYVYEKNNVFMDNLLTGKSISLMKFLMIEKNNKFYITDEDYGESFFKYNPKEKMPDNVFLLSDVKKEYNELLKTKMLDYCNSVNPIKITNKERIELLNNAARLLKIHQLNATDYLLKTYYNNMFNHSITTADVLADICSYKSKEDTMNEILDKNKNTIIDFKSELAYIENLIKNGDVAEQWESYIIKVLNSLSGKEKALNVTFKMNDKSATGKISPIALFAVINSRNEILSYKFCNEIDGKKVLKTLGAKCSNRDTVNKEYLQTKHITKITYGKKVLFER
jgi:hypothetical protein